MTNRLQPIYDIAALCAKRDLTNAILCPGSRNAPIVLAFTRHPQIRCQTISDERSAAFIALGIAQQTRRPAVLISTSGTAALNFAPAVAEAYFSRTPLIIITADRPSEWIAQQDGQTIYQHQIFGNHVKGFFQLAQEYDHADIRWGINRMVNDAINSSMADLQGPVHINIPLREPLYPHHDTAITYSDQIRVIDAIPGSLMLSDEQKSAILDQWASFQHVLVVAGQQHPDEALLQSVSNSLSHHNIPLVGDIISNFHSIPGTVAHSDVFLQAASPDLKKTLQPDLLITFGNSSISKNLKIFLRAYPAKAHWHIQPSGDVPDTYQSLAKVFHVRADEFFNFINVIPRDDNFESQKQNNYTRLWEVEERRAQRCLNEFFPQKELGEFEVVSELLASLPPACNLHLSNSMSVRYANYIGLRPEHKQVHVYANRGTSGIDGCTSTAVGHTMTSGIPNILITGDMAFFYDRNAFWHNYVLPNLFVVLLNNHGGIIFKMIDGPDNLAEADEFFITNQKLNAKKLCEEFGFEYLKLDTRRKLKNLMKDLIEPGETVKVMEIQSSIDLNKTIFEDVKMKIKKSYEF